LAQLLVRDPALKNQYPDNAKRPEDGAPLREEGFTFFYRTVHGALIRIKLSNNPINVYNITNIYT